MHRSVLVKVERIAGNVGISSTGQVFGDETTGNWLGTLGNIFMIKIIAIRGIRDGR